MSHFLSHWFVYESMFKIKPAVKSYLGSDFGHLMSCLQLGRKPWICLHYGSIKGMLNSPLAVIVCSASLDIQTTITGLF